jgi:hypothetical protein
MAFTQLVSLDQMRNTVRRMTARYDEAQMSTPQIDYYINLAYTIHFPEQFKNLKLTKPYVLLTTPNVDTYDFVYEAGLVDDPTQLPLPGNKSVPGNIQITPPVYCQGYRLRYFQDKNTFYNMWPNLSVNQQIGSGKGTSGPYSGIIPSTPFYRGQLDIFGNVTEPAVIISAIVNNVQSANSGFTYTLTDVPQPNSATPNIGLLVDINGVQAGTVNYLTGAWQFTVNNLAIIPLDATIYAAVVPYMASRPTDVLFYNQQIIFRPCPLQVFQVEFQISQQPTQLIASGSAPELDEWYMFICAIAAKLIYTDFPDPEGMAYLMPIYQDQLQMAQRRTLRQMSSQRAQTIFSQLGRPLAGYFYGTEYSGSGI